MAKEDQKFAQIVDKSEVHQVLGAARRTGVTIEVVPSGQMFSPAPDVVTAILSPDEVGMRFSGDPKAFDTELLHIRELTPASRWQRFSSWLFPARASGNTRTTGDIDVVHHRRLLGRRIREGVVVPETGETVNVTTGRDIVDVFCQDPVNDRNYLVSRTRAKNMPKQSAVARVLGQQ